MFSPFQVEGGEPLMEILESVLENTLTVFFTTLAAGYATRILSKKKTKKNSPAPRKRKGSSSK